MNYIIHSTHVMVTVLDPPHLLAWSAHWMGPPLLQRPEEPLRRHTGMGGDRR